MDSNVPHTPFRGEPALPTSSFHPLIRPFLVFLMLLAPGASAESFEKEPFPSPGPGYCDADGRFCDVSGCRSSIDPISQVACRCSLIDPSCGVGYCSWNQPSGWMEGPHCSFPHALSPSHPASLVLCSGAGLNLSCGLDCTPPPPLMRAWWTMDRVSNAPNLAVDIEGGNHGTSQGGALHVQGMVSEAIYFDGVDDRVAAPLIYGNSDHPYYNLTIDAWIRPDSVQSSDNGSIVEWAGSNPGYYDFFISDNELGFAFCDNQTCWALKSIGAGVLPGKWSHVAVVFNLSAHIVSFYVDGQFINTRTWTGPSVWFSGVGNSWVLGQRFHGAIDEVEIFERVLSISEIRAIYEAGSAGKCKPAP